MSNLPTPINLNDTTPVSPNGEVLVKWQGDNANPRNVSAYVPYSNATEPGAMLNVGDFGGTGENPTVEGLKGIEITEAPTADGQVLQFVADGVSDAGVAFGSLKFPRRRRQCFVASRRIRQRLGVCKLFRNPAYIC
jgi:hypothetical protein